MNELIFKKAGAEDINLIHNLAAAIWRKHYPGIITNEQIEYMIDKMYSPESLLKQLKDDNHFYLAYINNEPVGYFSYSMKEPGKYFLHKIYLLTDGHRKGIGGSMLEYLLNLLPPKSTVELTVNRKNYKSINFYFKNGFYIKEVKDFDIGAGFLMEDFVMIKEVGRF